MKLGILVTGPNASGKTTAVDTIASRFLVAPQLTVVHGDLAPYSKGSPAEMVALLGGLWAGTADVVLIEGIDRTARAVAEVARVADRRLVVHLTLQAPDVMRAHLRARCEKRGKTFNDPYWTDGRLTYEGLGRYAALAGKYFGGVPVRRWMVDESYGTLEAMTQEIERDITLALS